MSVSWIDVIVPIVVTIIIVAVSIYIFSAFCHRKIYSIQPRRKDLATKSSPKYQSFCLRSSLGGKYLSFLLILAQEEQQPTAILNQFIRSSSPSYLPLWLSSTLSLYFCMNPTLMTHLALDSSGLFSMLSQLQLFGALSSLSAISGLENSILMELIREFTYQSTSCCA